MISGPQGPRVVLDGQAGAAALLEQLPRPRRSPARARGRRRRGDALGRRRRQPRASSRGRCGSTASSRRRLAEFKHAGSALLFGSGYLANVGVVSALAGARRGRLLRRAQPRLDRRRLPALAGRDVRLPPQRHRAPGVGARARLRARRADRHRLGVLDGRRRRAAGRARRARAPPPRAARRRRGSRRRLPRARAAAAPSTRPGSSTRSTSSSARSARRSAATAPTSTCDAELARYLVNRSRPFIFSTAPPAAGRRRRRSPRSSCSPRSRAASSAWRRTAPCCAKSSRARASTSAASTTQIVPLVIGDAAGRDADLRAGDRAAACSRRRSARRRCPRARRACASP